jgi:Uma2 family endonuclease
MSTYPVPRLFTPEEYLLIEREAERKSEYADGMIYAMAGAGFTHNRIASNVLGSLYGSLQGTPYAVNNSDEKVAVTRDGPFYYPDVSVSCGDPSFWDARTDVILDPCVIVEVLSRSTARYDRTVKLAEYQRMASVGDILLISQDSVRVELHSKDLAGCWTLKVFDDRSQQVVLGGAGRVALPLSAVYDRIEF